jgi:hypothetical protein
VSARARYRYNDFTPPDTNEKTMKLATFIAAMALLGAVNAEKTDPSNGSSTTAGHREVVQLAQMIRQYRTNRAPGALPESRASNYEENAFSEVDSAATPERKLGEILKRNWVMNNIDSCQPSLPYRARLACAESSGAAFSLQYPADCRISVIVRDPPLVVQRKWDGSAVGSTLIARQVAFDLRSLREDKISVSPLMKLYFQVSRFRMPVISVAMSGDADKWITLPSPPLEEDFTADFPDPAARIEALSQATFQWSKVIGSYGHLPHDRQSFVLSPQFLTVTTQAMAGLWYPGDGAVSSAAQSRLLDILKSILSKCHD